MPMHHSESAVQPNQFNYYQQKPTVTHHNTCPSYAASASMGYRSFSNDSQTQKASPQQPSLSRQPSLNMMTNGPNGMNYQQGPSTFQRQVSHGYGAPSQQQSYQRQNLYPTQSYYNGQSYTQPASVEMPRSLSYPSNYTQLPYPAYDQAMSTPSSLSHQHPPSLDRHNTTSVIGESMAGMDLSRQGPSLGYSFANRLPLTERPFKCDECVQSFVSSS